MLEVKDLVMRFYTYDGVVNALNGVSFKVDKGEIFGLVGATGCGKSVTCYSILHLLLFVKFFDFDAEYDRKIKTIMENSRLLL